MVCQFIESHEWEALAEMRLINGTRQTKRLRGSVALPITDTQSSLFYEAKLPLQRLRTQEC